MGTIFTLSSDIRKVAQTLLDDMINELGKKIKLIYEPVKSECPNCILEPLNNRSSGIYQSGGPSPFTEGQLCPICNGDGWVVSESKYDIITVGIVRNQKDYYIVVPNTIVIPEGSIQIKAFATDWPRIKRARELQLAPDKEGYEIERYKLHSSLGDPSNLVQGRYCVGIFIRI